MSSHILLAFLISYLLGSIPFGYIFSKILLKKDVRQLGSGNIGATNVLRTGNKSIAALTLVCDGAKGVLALLIVQYLQLYSFGDFVFQKALTRFGLEWHSHTFFVVCASISVLGHVFPLWLKFKGGKGVATALGVTLYLSPFLGFLVIALWLLVAKLFRISSLAALLAFYSAPLLGWLCKIPNDLTCLFFFFAVLMTWTHRDNIQRLRQGVEKL